MHKWLIALWRRIWGKKKKQKTWMHSHTAVAARRTFVSAVTQSSSWNVWSMRSFLKRIRPLFNALARWCYSVHPPHQSWVNKPQDWSCRGRVSGHAVAEKAIWEETQSSGLMTWGIHMTYYFAKMDRWPEDCCFILCAPCALEPRQLTWFPPVNIQR